MPQDRFVAGLAFVFSREGGLVNDPDDSGGLTNFGVTQATFDSWNEKRGAPKTSVANIRPDQAKALYQSEYWDKANCDKLPEPLDILHFDAAVNHGVLNAGRMLQEALGMAHNDIDGQVGPKTLGTAQGADPIVTFARLTRQRLALYIVLAQTKPGQRKFLKGWLHRLGHALVELV